LLFLFPHLHLQFFILPCYSDRSSLRRVVCSFE
jgi:hypothetical protein